MFVSVIVLLSDDRLRHRKALSMVEWMAQQIKILRKEQDAASKLHSIYRFISISMHPYRVVCQVCVAVIAVVASHVCLQDLVSRYVA